MRKLLAFVAFLLLGGILFLGVIRMVGWQEVWQATRGFWGAKGLLVLVLTFFMLSLGALRWREILRHQGYLVSFWFLLKSYLGGFALSFFSPMIFFGSELFKAYSIHETQRVPFSRSMVSVVIERFLEFTAYLFLIGAGIAFLLFTHAAFISPLFWWALLLISLFTLLLLFFYIKSHRKESILRIFFPKMSRENGFLAMEQEVLRFFQWRNRVFWEGLFLSFSKAASMILRTFVLAGFLGEALSFFPALSITGFSILSLLIPIPAQLGSHEALQVASFQLLGFQGHTGAAFALLVRAAELFVASIGLVFLFRIGARVVGGMMFRHLTHLFHRVFSS